MYIENSGANSVTKIKHWRQGYRVTDPDRGNRYENIKAQTDCRQSRKKHLKRNRHKREKYSDRDGAGKGFSIDVPETGVMQPWAEEPDQAITSYYFRVR